MRVLLGLGLAASMVGGDPELAMAGEPTPARLLSASFGELALGMTFVLALQLMFGALGVAGRILDIQAGFGLGGVINPATGQQAPLVGTLFTYAAGAVFFALNGHADLMIIVRASLEAIPLGSGIFHPSLAHLAAFMSVVFALAFGVAGGAILCLFLVDLTIAFLSRTVPQMNVLILSLQVKTLVLLLTLPLVLGSAGALLARMTAVTLQAIPGLM
jgi:flagellar biosynthetic protein FliR